MEMPTIAELKDALKAKGIKGVSGKSKAELMAMLEGKAVPAKAPKAPVAMRAAEMSPWLTAMNRMLGKAPAASGGAGGPPAAAITLASHGLSSASLSLEEILEKHGYIAADAVKHALTRLSNEGDLHEAYGEGYFYHTLKDARHFFDMEIATAKRHRTAHVEEDLDQIYRFFEHSAKGADKTRVPLSSMAVVLKGIDDVNAADPLKSYD